MHGFFQILCNLKNISNHHIVGGVSTFSDSKDIQGLDLVFYGNGGYHPFSY